MSGASSHDERIAAYDDDSAEAFEGTLMDGLEDEPPYPTAARRWKFDRYDHRQNGISHSRGFLHYIGGRSVLLVWGFHRGVIGGYGYGSRYNGLPYAWLEFTLYAPGLGMGKSIYPRIRIPRSWL